MPKGGSKVEVNLYYMSMWFGVSVPIDTLLSLTIKEKTAWSGEQSVEGAITINEPDLFGGDKKEGGVNGICYYLPGGQTQVLPDALAQKLGRADGADCPGARGKTSLFFHGTTPAGFYWTANTPYIPGVWATVLRAPVGLNPDFALIPRLGVGEEIATGVTVTTYPVSPARPDPFFDCAFNPEYTTLSWVRGTSYVVWDLNNMVVLHSGTFTSPPSADLSPIGVLSSGIILFAWADDVYSIDPVSGLVSLYWDTDKAAGVQVILDGNGLDHWGTIPNSIYYDGWFDGGTFSFICQPNMYLRDSFGNIWVVGCDTPASTRFSMKRLVTVDNALGLGDTITVTMPSTAGSVFGAPSGDNFLISWGGTLYIIDPVAVTATATGTTCEQSDGSRFAWQSLQAATTYIWVGNVQYNLDDGAVLQTIGEIGASSTYDTVYDPHNHAIIGHDNNLDELDWWFLPHNPGVDANPAHIIYECLTNKDWGIGSPASGIDFDQWDAVGEVLYNEGLGLSLLWIRQSKVEDFVQEILDHIKGVVYVDPQTGLLSLALIRGDYDAGSLDVLTPDNADLTSFSRKLWGEITNEIVVTWTNPDNEQEETITVQDLASVGIQGGIISASRNYYGVRYASLAQKLAWRDLASDGQPLASCDASVDRTEWDLRPASVVKVTWPEYGLAEIVFRVMSIDYGKPGDPTIRLQLMEDVFGLDVGTYGEPPSTSWVDPSVAPANMQITELLTLPLYSALGSFAMQNLSGDPVYPEVVSGVLTTTSITDTYSAELWDEITQPDATLQWEQLSTLNVLGHGVLAADLDREDISTGVAFDSLIGQNAPTVSGFVMMGGAGETGNEIALITAGDYTLQRGVLDTVPRAWPAGTPCWFVQTDSLFEDNLIRAAGEEVSYKVRSRTSQGLLSLGATTEVSYTLSDRPWLPNRPADVIAYGEAWSSEAMPINTIGRADPWITTSWAVRNRLEEDTAVLAWTDASMTPETGQTTTIEVRSLAGSLLATHDSLSGTTFDVPDTSFGSESIVEFRVMSKRTDGDGDFVSLQYFSHWLLVATLGRLTEADEYRLTESGEIRVMES